jgi:2-dehydropantoate 2-reductase
MKTAVLGCGAIGGLVLASLAQKGEDVIGVVRDYQKVELDKNGIFIEGVGGGRSIKVNSAARLRQDMELAIFACKINDLDAMVRDNFNFLKNSLVVSTQNGVYADCILRKYFQPEKILTGIVMFGATYYPPNKIVHNFPGDLVVGNMFGAQIDEYSRVKAYLSTVMSISESVNIRGSKYLKVFVNLNNCIPAILGVSMQEAFADLDLAVLSIRLNREAFSVVEQSGIVLENLPGYPKERLIKLVSGEMVQTAEAFSQIMQSLSKEPLYGSILQSIQRGKKSEIDYINGEIVRLAAEKQLDASLNSKMVELVHEVEDTKRYFTKDELMERI